MKLFGLILSILAAFGFGLDSDVRSWEKKQASFREIETWWNSIRHRRTVNPVSVSLSEMFAKFDDIVTQYATASAEDRTHLKNTLRDGLFHRQSWRNIIRPLFQHYTTFLVHRIAAARSVRQFLELDDDD